MGEEFKITFVVPKEEVRLIIDDGSFSAILEDQEKDSMQNALTNGSNEVVLTKKSDTDAKKEKLENIMGLLQEALEELKESFDN